MGNNMDKGISEAEAAILQQVAQTQKVSDTDGYEMLIRSRYVFEYIDDDGSWYQINPVLTDFI